MPSGNKEGELVVVGFWGRGNAGDEAMLQGVYEAFSDRFDIIVSVDEHGAYPGFRDWYPYDRCRVVHRAEVGFTCGLPNLSGVLVGGGSLPVGIAAQLVMVARMRGVATAMAGVDLWPGDPDPASRQRRVIGDWLSFFDTVSVRSAFSRDVGTDLGHPVAYGADWALGLEADGSPDVTDDPRRALVVLREHDASETGRDYLFEVFRLLAGLVDQGYEPVLLPFSPHDAEHAERLGLQRLAPVTDCWWNAKRLKQVIASSGLTVSLGRLHPIIFSAGTGRAVAAVTSPAWEPGAPQMEKVRGMAAELGVGMHQTVRDFLAALRRGEVGPADPVLVAAAKARLRSTIATLHASFGPRHDVGPEILPVVVSCAETDGPGEPVPGDGLPDASVMPLPAGSADPISLTEVQGWREGGRAA